MAYTISFVSQKGGTGKTSLARTLSAEIIRAGKKPYLADLDTQQASSAEWSTLRSELGQSPDVTADEIKSVREAQNLSKGSDVLIIDGRPAASSQTLEAAQVSDIIVIPTSNSFDDLKPSVALAHSLADAGIPENKIRFALSLISTDAEARNSREWLEATGYTVLPGHILFRPSWRKCAEEGTALTETKFKSVNESARPFFDGLIKQINK